jgi:hypothetical protein
MKKYMRYDTSETTMNLQLCLPLLVRLQNPNLLGSLLVVLLSHSRLVILDQSPTGGIRGEDHQPLGWLLISSYVISLPLFVSPVQ